MKKYLIIAVILTFCSNFAKAGELEIKCYMSYADFAAEKWSSIETLTNVRPKQVCQLKQTDMDYRIKTGDKELDAFIKKNVFAVEYAGHLYVNCRNLRCNDFSLDVSNFTQAYRYDGNKICVVAYWVNKGAFMASIAGDILSIASPLEISLPAATASTAIWFSMDKLNQFRCYLLEGDVNAKGNSVVTRITDEVMASTLSGNPELLERYMAVKKKGVRQSASNILPVLYEQGLVKEL